MTNTPETHNAPHPTPSTGPYAGLGAWTVTDCEQAWLAFAGSTESAGSPVAELARAVADDRRLLTAITQVGDALPNLWLAVTRLKGAPLTRGYGPWRDWLVERWTGVTETMRHRAVQTNEVNRCTYLTPALSLISQQHGTTPLAVIEVGASAGLLLNLNRYRHAYNIADIGIIATGPSESRVTASCTAAGPVPVPNEPPRLAWRAGLDPHPLNARDQTDTAWLATVSAWPGQTERLDRLREALTIAREQPPFLIRGGVEHLRAVAAQAPSELPLVVIDVGVARYLSPAQRTTYAHEIRDVLGAHHISADIPTYLPQPLHPGQPDNWPEPPDPLTFIITLNGKPQAMADLNGHHLYWHDDR